MKSELQKQFEADHGDFSDNPLAVAIMKEALAIQDRFKPEPIFARTGKGYLKSVGVKELERDIEFRKELATSESSK